MYGQFQNSVSSAAKWIVVAFFGVIIMAILLGVNIKDAKWLNPSIAKAEAERIQVEAAHQQATYEIQERLAAAQTEAEIKEIQRQQALLDAQYAAEMQKIKQDIVNRQRWADVRINLFIVAGGALSIVTTIGGLILAIAKAIAILRSAPKSQPSARSLPEIQMIWPVSESATNEPLKTPQPSANLIQQHFEMRLNEELARVMAERKERDETISRMESALDPARMSKNQYNTLPHAE
jgi:multidrug efflux pump subunit AcrA (membrane-fusion protein)